MHNFHKSTYKNIILNTTNHLSFNILVLTLLALIVNTNQLYPNMKNALLLTILSIFTVLSINGQPSWTYQNTGTNHTILVQPAAVNIDGVSLSTGDYLGVFYTIGTGPDLACAGYELFTGQNLGVTAWGSEPGLNNGFAFGEEFKWKVWRASDGIIVDMTASYQTIGFPNTSMYSTNGISGIASLTGSAPVVSFEASGTSYDVSCYDACDGSIALNVSGGTPPYSYAWSNGGTDAAANNLCAGNYTVTVSDSEGGSTSAFDWTYFNTGSNHTILLQPSLATIDGTPLQIGDYVGVFYTLGSGPDLACGGYELFTGQNLGISAWGSEAGLNNGFAVGETFKWKVWRATSGEVVDMTATYATGGFSNQGTYVSNGISGLASLTGTSSGTGGGSANTQVLSFTITQPDEIIVEAEGSTIAAGANNGTITTAVVGGVLPYSYSWNNGATTANLSGLSPGTYCLVITDAAGCEAFVCATVSEESAPFEASGTSYDVSCYDACDGSIALNVSGGTPPYSYAWSNGGTSPYLSWLCAGVYSFTISDADGTILTDSYEIYEPNIILINPIVSEYNGFNISSAGAADGYISLYVTGGVLPYSYSWNNGETTSENTGLQAGTYTVTITDGNGCIEIAEITLNEPGSLSLSFIIDNVTCFGGNDGSISIQVIGGSAPYSYIWSNGASSSVINELLAGIYYLTVEDSNGASITEILVAHQPAAININLSSTGVYSGDSDGTVSSSVSGGVTPYTYIWSNGETSAHLSGLEEGSYCLSISDANSCEAEACIDVPLITPTHFTLPYSGNPYNPMNIFVLDASLDAGDLSLGSEIAVFDGNLCVGFGVYNGSWPLTFPAAMDDPLTTAIDGFASGNDILFKIFDADSQTELTFIDVNFQFNSPEVYTSLGTAIVVIEAYTIMEQCIPLSAGWNLVSFYLSPDEPVIDSIFSPLVANGSLVKVLDESGHFMQEIGSFWFNNIPTMSLTKGYYVNVNQADTLCILGQPTSLPFDIPLIANWNIMGFPSSAPHASNEVFQNLINNNVLVKVLDQAGNFIQEITPNYWFDNILSLTPGQGYYINVNSTTTLSILNQSKSLEFQATNKIQPEHFSSVHKGNPYQAMSVLIADCSGARLSIGDEVAIFDGDICIGAAVYEGEIPFAVACAMDDPLSNEIDGFTEGNYLQIKVWRKSGDRELNSSEMRVSFDSNFDRNFKAKGTAVIDLDLNDEFTNSWAVYPNPVLDYFTIDFTLDKEGYVSIELLDARGSLVETIWNGYSPKGKSQVRWENKSQKGSSLSAGVYHIRYSYDSKTENKRIVLMK